jgi:hypothetical protein
MLCICLPALLVLLALIAPACAELELLAAGPVRPPRLDELLDLLRPLRT